MSQGRVGQTGKGGGLQIWGKGEEGGVMLTAADSTARRALASLASLSGEEEGLGKLTAFRRCPLPGLTAVRPRGLAVVRVPHWARGVDVSEGEESWNSLALQWLPLLVCYDAQGDTRLASLFAVRIQ